MRPRKPSRREREREARRREIFMAAERVFSRKGFHAATMSEIAREAEFGMGTLYSFYPSKQKLIAAFVEAHLAECSGIVRRAAATSSEPQKQIEAIMRDCLGYIEQHRNLYRLYLQEFPDPMIRVRGIPQEKIERFHREGHGIVEEVLRRGIARGLFRKVDVQAAALALFGLLDVFPNESLVVDPETDLRSKLPVVVDLYLNGVSA